MAVGGPEPGAGLPPLVSTLARMLAQDMGKIVAGLLLGYGLIQTSQRAEAIDVSVSILLGLASIGWTAWMHAQHAQTAANAVQAGVALGAQAQANATSTPVMVNQVPF